MATNIETLTVTLELVTKGFNQSMGSVGAMVVAFGRRVFRLAMLLEVLKKAANVAKKAIVVFGAAMAKAVGDATRLARVSRRLGATVEGLAGLQFMAEQQGVAFRQFELGMQRLVRRAQEAANGIGEARAAFELLGIEAADLARQSPERQLEMIAEAMSGLEDQGGRVFAAFRTFEAEGVEFVQFLQEGVGNMRALRAEAERLGAVVTRGQAIVSEKFVQALAKLRVAFEAIARKVSTDLLPGLTIVVDIVTDILVAIREWLPSLKVFGLALGLFFIRAENLFRNLSAGWDFFKSAAFTALAGVFKAFTEFVLNSVRTFLDGMKRIRQFLPAQLKAALGAIDVDAVIDDMMEKVEELEAGFREMAKTAKEEGFDALNESTRLLIERTQKLFNLFSQSFEAGEEAAKNTANATAEVTEEVEKLTDAQQQAFAFGQSAANSVLENLKAMAAGTKSAAEAFADMALSILQDIQRILVKMLVLRAIEFFGSVPTNTSAGLGLQGTSGIIPLSQIKPAAGGAFVGTGGIAELHPGEVVLPSGVVSQLRPGGTTTNNNQVNMSFPNADMDSFRRNEVTVRKRMEQFLIGEGRRGVS